MSSTAKDTAVKEMNTDKAKSTQREPAYTAPAAVRFVGLPLEELKDLRAEMRLG